MSSGIQPEDSGMVALARSLADPLRLRILEELMVGPATVSELVAASGASQPNISNHLAVLRQGGLVHSSSVGRQKRYELAGFPVARLVESLMRISGGTPAPRRTSAAIVRARTCYDHLAGRLGVRLFDALVSLGGIEDSAISAERAGRDRGEVTLGPDATAVFRRLGVEVEEVRSERRHFASCCIDWTEHRPHLSGALGAALWRRFLEAGWVVRDPGSRSVVVTRRGTTSLRKLLGLDLEDGGE